MSSNLYDAISDCLDRVATRAWTIFGGSPNPEPLKIDKKEDLKDLKHGQIVIDDEGKMYKVRKSMISEEWTAGPHGLGKPDGKSLRHAEIDDTIQEMMNEELEKTDCHVPFDAFTGCMKKGKSMMSTFTCRPELTVFAECKKKKLEDPMFRQRITNEYLKARSEYRAKGKGARQLRFDEFITWKLEKENKKE